MKSSSEYRGIIKYGIFSILPLVILLIIAEVGLRIYYFQIHGLDKLALVTAYRHGRHLFLKSVAQYRVRKLDIPAEVYDALFSEEGEELLREFEKEYESEFKKLVDETHKIRSKLLVLYIPPGDYQKPSISTNTCRNFYHGLAEKYNIDFCDMTQAFTLYPFTSVTMMPENGHLSRFGNQLIVRELSNYIDKYSDYRMNYEFTTKAKLLGDLVPDDSRVWSIDPLLPYLVITNKQGLRMDYDITFPKQKQRIVILGDSYTFGPYLPNHHTYPGLLDKKYPDKEVINAGIAGYTITDEVSLFMERTRYVEPDITILQVTDNDLTGLFFFVKNQYDRKRRVYTPSEYEHRYLTSLKAH